MGALSRFERRVQEAVHGAFARAFKSEVQPVEIASALQRECADKAAIVSRGRTMIPNAFVVELGEHDSERLQQYLEPLRTEFADMVREYAREQSYSFVGPVTVDIERLDELETGMFRVRSSAVTGPAGTDWSRGGGTRGPALALEVNGIRHALSAPVMTIGRGDDVDVRIDDAGVSRRHAEVHRHPADEPIALLVDLGSTNGIRAESGRVSRVELHDGDSVVLGSTTVRFHAG
jgi:hypothetical protein